MSIIEGTWVDAYNTDLNTKVLHPERFRMQLPIQKCSYNMPIAKEVEAIVKEVAPDRKMRLALTYAKGNQVVAEEALSTENRDLHDVRLAIKTPSPARTATASKSWTSRAWTSAARPLSTAKLDFAGNLRPRVVKEQKRRQVRLYALARLSSFGGPVPAEAIIKEYPHGRRHTRHDV